MPKTEKKRAPRTYTLTPRELRFVAAYKGSAAAAGRAAGVPNSSRMIKIPRVAAAIERKMDAAIIAAGKQLGRDVAKGEVLERALEISKYHPKETKGELTGQLDALREIIKVQGWLLQQAAQQQGPQGASVYKALQTRTVSVSETRTLEGAAPAPEEPEVIYDWDSGKRLNGAS